MVCHSPCQVSEASLYFVNESRILGIDILVLVKKVRRWNLSSEPESTFIPLHRFRALVNSLPQSINYHQQRREGDPKFEEVVK